MTKSINCTNAEIKTLGNCTIIYIEHGMNKINRKSQLNFNIFFSFSNILRFVFFLTGHFTERSLIEDMKCFIDSGVMQDLFSLLQDSCSSKIVYMFSR